MSGGAGCGAIVTGGAGGIGQAVIARLARDGFLPVSWDVQPTPGGVAVDVTDADALVRAAAESGPVRALVINAVTPTVGRTSMERDLAPERRAFLLEKIPLARFAEPEEVAAMVSFLCSRECSFSTGAVFDLSGGRATS